MAAAVESLMYVREVPWHGLGKQLEYAPSSKEAIIAAELDWRVDSLPIYDAAGKEIPGFKANTRDKDGKVLGIVGKKYTIVQNADAFDFTDSLIDEGMVYETAGSLLGGRKIWLLGKMPEQKILDDAVEPYVCFVNSHDGTGAVKVCMVNVRVVCNNTLNLALKTAKRTWSTTHVGNMDQKLTEARETLGLIEEYNNALAAEAEILATKKISDLEINKIFDTVYPIDPEVDSKRKIENVAAIKGGLMRCYDAPDIANFKGTVWGLMNAVSDYISHSTPNRVTDTYRENNFGRIITGHPIFDQFYRLAKAA